MSAPVTLTFYMEHFQTSVNASKLLKRGIVNYSFAAENVLDIAVPKSKISSLFSFYNGGNVTDPNLLISTSGTLFKFGYDSAVFTSNFGTAVASATDSSSSYVEGLETPGLLYLKYIALKLTGVTTTYNTFADITTQRDTINTSTDSAIKTKFTALTATSGSQGLTSSIETDNPSLRVTRQIDFASQMARFTSTILTDAQTSFQPLPILIGDKFIFRVDYNPATEQEKVKLRTTDADLVNPIDTMNTIIRITVIEG